MKKLLLLICLTGFITSSLNFKTPDQIFTTSLQVIVRNELGNAEKGVKVRLFKSKEDYDQLINPSTETFETDEKGKVLFKNLEPVVYYIIAEKDAANNAGAGEQTAALESNKLNKITVVISE